MKIKNVLNRIAHQLADRFVPRDEPDLFERFLQLVPSVLSVVQAYNKPAQIIPEGPHMQQVRAEFNAERATFDRELAEKHARLVAAFGPRFIEARKLDEECAPVGAGYAQAPAAASEANGHACA